VYDDQGWHKIECPTCGANVSVRTRPAKATRLEPPAAFQCRHTPIEHCPDLWPRIAAQQALPLPRRRPRLVPRLLLPVLGLAALALWAVAAHPVLH
jgi:hypothetical protein